MTRTTSDWEKLLEGATPGPWEHDGESGVRGPRETDDLGRGPALLAAMQMPHRQPRKRHNAALMTSAPEAVAEVIRLRRELEELRDGLEWNGTQVGSDQNEQAHFEAHGEVARSLTNILNPKGDS